MREADLAALRGRLEAAAHELEDLRAIRDALTPPELPQRPGLQLAAAFLPANAEQVSGDFYLVAEGPQDSTVLVVGDGVGRGTGWCWSGWDGLDPRRARGHDRRDDFSRLTEKGSGIKISAGQIGKAAAIYVAPAAAGARARSG